MASTTKGSIKISTANGIGAALVDVLGGEGYKPDEWEQNINICGIHAADIESALENIEEDAGTGTERGSILLSTANAIGATLNKKFNTSRGFSPREWASAASKLEPLPERTASGAVANLTDGADGVPIKNWLVTLPASLDGVSSVGMVQSGKNLLNPAYVENNYHLNATTGLPYAFNGRIATTTPVSVHGGTVTVSFSTSVSNIYFMYSTFKNGTLIERVTNKTSGDSINLQDADELYICIYGSNNITTSDVSDIQIEVGSTATAYEAYEAPTQYTASLGRTIYGGTADIVTGEGEDENGNAFTFTPITPAPETALGVNNFWADEGDSDVTYRADISLALQALGGGGRGLMMMRPTEPEETEETEGLDDELNR